MGGSFSARVPRSSAEVRRVFVHHILEDEVDGQEEGQGDQREDGEEEEVNGVVEEYQCEKWTCEVWCSHPRRLQQTTVSCIRSNWNKPKKS